MLLIVVTSVLLQISHSVILFSINTHNRYYKSLIDVIMGMVRRSTFDIQAANKKRSPADSFSLINL